MKKTATSDSRGPDPMRADARRVTRLVSDAWLALIRSTRGGTEFTRPTQLARSFGLSEKLAWQVWRAAHATSPAELLAHLPGEQGIEIALQAAAKAGAPRPAIARARDAAAQVDRLVRKHAGDRASLAMMLAPAGASHVDAPRRRDRGRPRNPRDEELRRQAFLGTSHLWGVQARTHLGLSILYPGGRDDRVDIASIRGVIDLRRLRADVPWIITRSGCRVGNTTGHPDGRWREPMTSRSTDPDRAPIIEEFCSSPIPEVRAIPVGKTLIDVEIGRAAVGDAGSVTCICGEILHNLPRYRPNSNTDANTRGRLSPIIFTPCERLIQDVIVHRGAEIIEPFALNFYGDPRGEGLEHRIERNRLPIRAQIEHLGRGLDALDTPFVPRYRELVIRAHELAGWSSSAANDDFVAYRIQLAYPPTPCMLDFEFSLPEAP